MLPLYESLAHFFRVMSISCWIWFHLDLTPVWERMATSTPTKMDKKHNNSLHLELQGSKCLRENYKATDILSSGQVHPVCSHGELFIMEK